GWLKGGRQSSRVAVGSGGCSPLVGRRSGRLWFPSVVDASVRVDDGSDGLWLVGSRWVNDGGGVDGLWVMVGVLFLPRCRCRLSKQGLMQAWFLVTVVVE
ncbi:hypothetical protein Dimus_010866, partial [Dionaea muscipula]